MEAIRILEVPDTQKIVQLSNNEKGKDGRESNSILK